jgi:prepilin-type N-terminal cleavage/methylation domain-containing protein
MFTRIRRSYDGGFTLVELLIAITIMGTAVSVLVLAMSSLVVDTQEGRGHSIADTAAHDLGEAIQAKVSFTTKLLAAIAATGTPSTISVVDASGFQTTPSATAPMEVLIDQELFTIKAISGNSLTVAARADENSEMQAHALNAVVSQDFICPTATSSAGGDGHIGYLLPDSWAPSGSLQPRDASGTQVATATIGEVDYWNPDANSFTSPGVVSTCIDNFQASNNGGIGCPDASTLLPQCDPGLERVKIHLDTTLGKTFRNVTTDTWVMIRRGSN